MKVMRRGAVGIGPMDERVQPGRKLGRSEGWDGLPGGRIFNAIERCGQFVFVKGDMDAVQFEQVAGGGKLVVVTGFAKRSAAGHYKNRLGKLERGEDGAHAGVGDDDAGRKQPLFELQRFEQFGAGNVTGHPTAAADLGEHILPPPLAGPAIHRAD